MLVPKQDSRHIWAFCSHVELWHGQKLQPTSHLIHLRWTCLNTIKLKPNVALRKQSYIIIWHRHISSESCREPCQHFFLVLTLDRDRLGALVKFFISCTVSTMFLYFCQTSTAIKTKHFKVFLTRIR